MRESKRRRPQPAKPAIRWEHRVVPDEPAAQRRMLQEMIRSVDDQAIDRIVHWSLPRACDSDTRADLAELARIKSRGIYIAGAPTVSMRELIPVKMKAKPSKRRARP
jgi:hypothetical protein